MLSIVPEGRIKRFGVEVPEEIEMTFLPSPFTDEELIEAARDVDCIFDTAVDKISRNAIENLPNLKFIQSEGVGFNQIDLEAASARNIIVSNNKNVNAFPVAEQTVGLIIAALRMIPYADREIKAGNYTEVQNEFRSEGYHELSSRHVGIVGFGAIGRELAKLLKAFGCEISYFDAFRPSREIEEELGVTFMEYDDICRKCNVISYHVPVLPETINMADMEHFKMMSKDTVILNVARGEIVHQEDLARALEENLIAGAALDTVLPEPPGKDHVLLNLSKHAANKLILTPHIAGTNDEAFERMQRWAYENMLAVMNGRKPNNIVNPK